MKFRYYFAMAAAALVMTNCSNEEDALQTINDSKSFTATIEGASRSSVTDEGVFSWTEGDKISVWTADGFDTYVNSTDVNTFTFAAQDENDTQGTAKDYAIYPAGTHNISEGVVTVNLPTEYAYGSTNMPMLATVENGNTNLSFKHLAGVMRFVVNGVPEGATKFIFTTTNDILTGNYAVDSEGEIKKDSEGTVSGNNSVTITFDALGAAQNMTFYVPMPVGTYGEYKVQIENAEDNLGLTHTSEGVTNTIGRRTLLLMPEFTVDNDGLKKGAGSTIEVTQSEVEISGNQSVTINTTGVSDASATLALNYTPQEGNATLNLSDGSSETTSQESIAKVQINPQGTTPVESLTINTPTLTVELGAGTYGAVEALTATQTLVIGEGVTIDELVLNGGNVELSANATIKKFTVPAEVTTTLNLNTYELNINNPNAAYCLINKGTMTIKNGTIAFTGNGTNGAAVCNMGEIELQDVDITSNSVCFRNYGATVENLSGKTAADATVTAIIIGGEFTSSYNNSASHSQHRYAVHAYMLSNMEMTGTTISGSGGVSVDVAFATLTNVTATHTCAYGAHDLYVPCGNATVTNCTFANAAAYSDDTYGKAVVNGVTYENGTTAIAEWIEIDTAEELVNALANGGSYKLTATITVDEIITATKPIAIVMNDDVTLNIANDEIAYGLINKSTMTIKNGTIAFTGNGTNGAAVCNMGEIELQDVNITSNSVCFRNYGATVANLSGKTAADATVTAVITGGEFTSSYNNTESHSQHRYAVHAYMLSNMKMTGTTISGSGGVSVDVAFATLTNVTATHTCTYGAHDLYVPCGNATVTNCTFANAAVYSDTTYGIAVVNGTPYNLEEGQTQVTKSITF